MKIYCKQDTIMVYLTKTESSQWSICCRILSEVATYIVGDAWLGKPYQSALGINHLK